MPNTEFVEVKNAHQQFYECVTEWELQLAGIDVNDPELEVLAEEIAVELEQICPYMDEIVHVSGRGVIPIMDDLTGEMTNEVFYSEGVTGQYMGVMVVPYQEQEDLDLRVRIMHRVLIGQAEENVSLSRYREEYFIASFLTEPGTSITDLADIESIFSPYFIGQESSESMNDRLRKVRVYTDKARELVCSTGFRRQPQGRQASALVSLVSEAERETRINQLFVTANSGYALIVQHGETCSYLIPYNLDDTPIKGMILGLESLENLRLREGRAIRRDSDLIDKNAGLCLVISPEDDTQVNLNLSPRQVIFLPLGSQSAGIVYSDTST